MKIIVVIPVNEEHKKYLESQIQAEFIYCKADEVTEEMAESADVMIGNIPAALVQKAKHLKLLQLNSAGTDGYTVPGVLCEGAYLANATGAYGLAISEHMLGVVLMLQKKLHLYRDQHQKAQWKDAGPVQSIWNSTTLVLGLGDIGSEFAARMKALGSYVIGIRRTGGEKPDCVDEIDTIENLDLYLGRADIIAMSLPGTPATYHIMNEETFRKMKPGAILVNVGRGTAIDQEALYKALTEGTLGACGLDVTDPEPLPAESPLWQCENLLITPHISGGFHLQETFERIVRIAAWNLKALAEGTSIRNEVDMNTGYRRR